MRFFYKILLQLSRTTNDELARREQQIKDEFVARVTKKEAELVREEEVVCCSFIVAIAIALTEKVLFQYQKLPIRLELSLLSQRKHSEFYMRSNPHIK